MNCSLLPVRTPEKIQKLGTVLYLQTPKMSLWEKEKLGSAVEKTLVEQLTKLAFVDE